MNETVKLACIAVLCGIILSCTAAYAQRTVRGQFFAEADYIHTFAPSASNKVLGGEAFFGQYLSNMYWKAGLSFTPKTTANPFGCFLASGGAMYRFFGTRNRVFSLYGGGNALFGLDFPDAEAAAKEVLVEENGKIVVSKDEDIPKAGIVYGAEPRLEAEVYFVRKVAFVAGVSVPLRISVKNPDYTKLVTFRAFAGLRIAF